MTQRSLTLRGIVFIAAAMITSLPVCKREPTWSLAAETASGPTQPYSPDPQHLWNRIHHHFHVRLETQIAGETELSFDPDEHDPMQWTRFPQPNDYLLAGPSHEDAIALLDEFLTGNGETLISDPLRKAFLQRDLWATFDWFANPIWSRTGKTRFPEERRELCLRLAQAIARLALSDEQITKLPDNYAAAVASRKYPAKHDPVRRYQSFLPDDLWAPEGTWVLLSDWASNPLAAKHVDFFQGRSTFAVFLRLPQGRDQTTKYLERLRDWQANGAKGDVPQVPPQTQVALARRMMVVDASGDIATTPVTESVQIRVIHEPSEMSSKAQTFLEFRLRRQELLAGRIGGLRAVPDEDCDRDDMLFLGPGSVNDFVPILASCRHCHSAPGILSLNSYTGLFTDGVRRRLVDAPLSRQEEATIIWKQNQYSWGLLTGVLLGKRSPSR